MPAQSASPESFPSSRYVGILLAGGEGARFRASAGDDQADKLLTPLPDGRPVALAAAAALREVAGRVLVVLRPGRPALREVLARVPGCELIETTDAARGMGASLAAAARHLLAWHANVDADADADAGRNADRNANVVHPQGVLVALGDMPWIAPRTLRAVCAAGLMHPVVAPVCDGQRGHPVAFAWDLLPQLARLNGDTGARELLRRHGVHLLPCDDPGVLRDVDTVADLG
ncbi:NTP transferase domain-containing protein [Bordetella sp. LUAb4]|uniref:nucleotidyltransferase family protein n=1 Tax=Bordetella sp. LUAb4 TaxID=2843195 RepID=UPI001E2C03E3|nr:nucleotidyltransferase family protein [Bordetella sp. LUAb4]